MPGLAGFLKKKVLSTKRVNIPNISKIYIIYNNSYYEDIIKFSDDIFIIIMLSINNEENTLCPSNKFI